MSDSEPLHKKSVLSLRSRRKHKAWGVSPRRQSTEGYQARECGRQSDRGKILTIMRNELSPISWARKFNLDSDPGACAPGFMLPPASQA